MTNRRGTAALPTDQLRGRPLIASLILVIGLAALAVGLAVSISVGAADIKLGTVWDAIFHYNPDHPQHQIIHELRLPRSLAAVIIGAAFAVAGAIMQGMTRNPLADPGLLGVNAGAGFALAICFTLLPGLPYERIILVSFLGAALGTALVYGIGSMSKGGLKPIRLTLAGAAVAALLVALSEGLAIYYNVSQDLAFWYAGGVAGTKWLQIKVMLPWITGGIIGAMILSRSISILSLGEQVAAGLGMRTGLVKLLGALLVLILAGGAVSAGGSIGFVGLVVPHLARMLVGVSYRWIIPCSAVMGSLLLLLADTGARIINPPYETPIGALIAVLGVPFFLYLARKSKGEL